MPDPARDAVEQRLTTAGLHGPAFDIDAITADYIDRVDMDRSLDTLIGSGQPGSESEDR